MDFKNKIVNNLFSKDFNTSSSAAQTLVNTADFAAFSVLAQNADNIFDFLKNKINNTLSQNVNKGNFKNIFTFLKLYSADFEDFIVNSLVRFADENLTDTMLEFLENGTTDEKSYAAKYFYHINDTAAIDALNLYALSDFPPLAYNCAQALSKFNDKTVFDKAIEILNGTLENEFDDYDKMKYVDFLTAYGDKAAFLPIFKYMEKSCYENEIAISLLDLKSFNEMEQMQSYAVFDRILSAYPELLHLDTLSNYEILNFLHTLKSDNTSYSSRLLLKAKSKFELFTKNDIYTYDLHKNEKNLVYEINNFLQNCSNIEDNLQEEFLCGNFFRVIEAVNIICELNLKKYAKNLKRLLKSTQNELVISEISRTLKEFNELQDISKDEILEKIKNDNLKILTASYFNTAL